MRIGVISDTHYHAGQSDLPDGVARAFADVGLIIHAGDLVTAGIIAALEVIAPVVAVRGNMDRRDVRWALPLRRELEAGGHRIGVIHGHGVPGQVWLGGGQVDFDFYHEYLLRQFDDVDCIVYGHTHWPRVDYKRGVLILNPGAAGGQSPAGYASVGILTVTEDGIEGEIVKLQKGRQR